MLRRERRIIIAGRRYNRETLRTSIFLLVRLPKVAAPAWIPVLAASVLEKVFLKRAIRFKLKAGLSLANSRQRDFSVSAS